MVVTIGNVPPANFGHGHVSLRLSLNRPRVTGVLHHHLPRMDGPASVLQYHCLPCTHRCRPAAPALFFNITATELTGRRCLRTTIASPGFQHHCELTCPRCLHHRFLNTTATWVSQRGQIEGEERGRFRYVVAGLNISFPVLIIPLTREGIPTWQRRCYGPLRQSSKLM